MAEMPDLDAIISGDYSAVPESIDLQYAIATALVGRALKAKNEGNAAEVYASILTYADRFPQKEMGVMLVSDLLRAVGDEIFALPEFEQWAQAVGDILLYG